ncbi:MAG: hypothetical protein IMX03_02800 [Brockia lithotrophica]|nr:hypothetical protein [Brockia lithotrophica]
MSGEIDWFSRGFAQAERVRTRYVLSGGHQVLRGEDFGALLASWIFARLRGGSFVVRVHDTGEGGADARTWEEFRLLVRDFSLSWDEGPDVGGPYGPYRVSRRLEVYRHFAELLLRLGKARAYLVSKSSPGVAVPVSADQVPAGGGAREGEVWIVYPYEGLESPSSLSFLPLPEGQAGVSLVSDRGRPSTLFAEVVDDALMDITTVFLPRPRRGELALREALFAALGFPPPEWRTFFPVFAFEEFRSVLAAEEVSPCSSSGHPASALLRAWLRLTEAKDCPALSQVTLDAVFPRMTLSSEGTQRPL